MSTAEDKNTSFLIKMHKDVVGKELEKFENFLREFCHADYVQYSNKHHMILAYNVSENYLKTIQDSNKVLFVQEYYLNGHDLDKVKSLDDLLDKGTKSNITKSIRKISLIIGSVFVLVLLAMLASSIFSA